MSKRSPVAVFLAASALLSVNTMHAEGSHASERKEKGLELNQQSISELLYANHHGEKKKKANIKKHEGHDMGGLKEWTTDQKIDEASVLDEAAKKAAKKAKKQDICIPIGEGENCW